MIQQYAMETGDDVSALNTAADQAIMDLPTQQAQWAAGAVAGNPAVAREAGLRATTGMNSAEFAQAQAIGGFLENAPSNSPLGAEMLSSRLTGMNRAGVARSADFASRAPQEIRAIGNIEAGLAPSWTQAEAAAINRGQLAVSQMNANTSRWSAEQSNQLGQQQFGLASSRFLMERGMMQSEMDLKAAQAARQRALAASGGIDASDPETAKLRMQLMESLQSTIKNRNALDLGQGEAALFNQMQTDYQTMLWGPQTQTPAQRAAGGGADWLKYLVPQSSNIFFNPMISPFHR